MWEWIESLQRKPEASRRRMALMIAAGLTLCIVLLWLALESAIPKQPVLTGPEDGTFSSVRQDLERLGEGARAQVEAWSSLVEAFRVWSDAPQEGGAGER